MTTTRTKPRLVTAATVAVLYVLLERRDEWTYGGLICTRTQIETGTVCTILGRLEADEWITRWDEEGQPVGRPRRRYCQLTDLGVARAVAVLASASGRRVAPAALTRSGGRLVQPRNDRQRSPEAQRAAGWLAAIAAQPPQIRAGDPSA